MDNVNDFFTAESLLTFAGATTATVVVPNALQKAFQFNPRWLALVVAQVACIAVVYNQHHTAVPGTVIPASDYLIALVNGCLVYCSAAGATSVGNQAAGGGAMGGGVARGNVQPEAEPRGEFDLPRRPAKRRGFFTPWF